LLAGQFVSTAATGKSYGLKVQAGTNATDYALSVTNKADSQLFRVSGNGNVGISISDPMSKLEIAYDSTITYPTLGSNNRGAIHITPTTSTNDNSTAITFGANTGIGIRRDAQAGIYVQSSGAYGTNMYFGTSGNFIAGPTAKLAITYDGRIYGTALHNNPGAVTGTTNQYIASGTYTPTLYNTTNIAASTVYACQWMRVGNVVTVSGKVDIDITTASTASELNLSLPIASDFTATHQCCGTCVAYGALPNYWVIFGDTTNNRVAFLTTGQASDINTGYSFTFTYLIL